MLMLTTKVQLIINKHCNYLRSRYWSKEIYNYGSKLVVATSNYIGTSY